MIRWASVPNINLYWETVGGAWIYRKMQILFGMVEQLDEK